MTGLKLSALSQIKLLTVISTVDDLNYPEKTNTYYIINVPYIFSACWKVVKPLLQERTRRRVQVLPGCGRDDLLKIMDYDSLPHFCKAEGSGSSRTADGPESCYSLNHPFHQAQLGFDGFDNHSSFLIWLWQRDMEGPLFDRFTWLMHYGLLLDVAVVWQWKWDWTA